MDGKCRDRPRSDPRAFDRFYREWHPFCLETALLLGAREEEVPDLVQDVFVGLLRRGGWEEVEHPRPFLRQAILWEIQRRRAPAAAEVPLTEELAENIPSKQPSPVELAARREEQRLLRACLERLPDRSGAVMQLHLEGLTHAEVGRCLGISRSAVEKQVARGRKRLREEARRRRLVKSRRASG